MERQLDQPFVLDYKAKRRENHDKRQGQWCEKEKTFDPREEVCWVGR